MRFEKVCKYVVRKFSPLLSEDRIKKLNESVSQQFLDAIIFTGMDIEPYEVIFFSYISAILVFILSIIFDAVIIAFYGKEVLNNYIAMVAMIAITVLFPLMIFHIVSEYPKEKAKKMKIHSLGDMPELLSYAVMYLKLIPNLENAFKFAASESKTTLAKYLRKILWDMEMRIYGGIEDALEHFAEIWGKWSEHFRRAIHLIKSSVHERNEGERSRTLDRSIDVILDGTKSMMIDFSNKLHQPTLIIYSIGIMMPLALVAMMPALSLLKMKISMGGIEIFILYDVILPFILLFYIRKILLSRPAAFAPPSVKVDMSRGRNILFAIIGGSISIIVCIFLWRSMRPFFPLALVLLIPLSISLSIYLMKSYEPYMEKRNSIKKMEKEFGDMLYLLGRRIIEGKPLEEAFLYASHAFKNLKIGEIFKKTSFNLISMRMDTSSALFDKQFGSLKHVYSDRIRAIMKLFVEGIKKSQAAAGVAVIKIAEHLKQLEEVEKNIKNALSMLTSTLKTTANVFAPIIGGIILGITKLMSNVMEKMPSHGYLSLASSLNPEYFVFAIGIYVAELVFILHKLANGIEEGDDMINYYHSIGKSLPSAILLFSISTILSYLFFWNISPV